MRPVNKGESPYQSLNGYDEALPYLEERIGMYCSYCEMRIDHAPEIEHIVSKSCGGNKTEWKNLLLACKYCNTRKADETTPENRDDYLWPDENNTEVAYTYFNGKPEVNRPLLLRLDQSGETAQKAEKLFDLVKLGNVPKLREKDRRFKQRNEAFDVASRSLRGWKNIKGKDGKKYFKETVIDLAKGYGFFSTWMEVFRDEPEIKNALLSAF